MSGSLRQQLGEDRPQLRAGERGAQAVVRAAAAEADVVVRVAGDVEAVGVARTPPRRGWPSCRRARPSRPRRSAGRASSVSRVAVRRNVDHRRGPAHELLDRGRQPRPRGPRPGSARWSGLVAQRPHRVAVVCRVVSLPATESSTKKAPISASVRRSPSTSACDERGHQVVAGVRSRSLGQLRRDLRQRPRSPRRRPSIGSRPASDLGVVQPRRARRRRSRRRSRSASGTPIMSADRHQRQPLGDELDEVAAAVRRRLLDDRRARARGSRPRSRDLARREGRRRRGRAASCAAGRPSRGTTASPRAARAARRRTARPGPSRTPPASRVTVRTSSWRTIAQ